MTYMHVMILPTLSDAFQRTHCGNVGPVSSKVRLVERSLNPSVRRSFTEIVC